VPDSLDSGRRGRGAWHKVILGDGGHGARATLYEKGFKLQLFGNEVYYTNSLLLLVQNMLCSKLHYQKDFNLKAFSCKISIVGFGSRDYTQIVNWPLLRSTVF